MDPITERAEPILNEQNDNNEEEIQQQPQIKKKELSQKQIDHLNNIRVKALEKKREIKLKKNGEYKKQAMEKKVNPIQQIELKPEVKQEVKPDEAKPKKKVIKQVIKYVEADEDDEDEEEEIIITKPKNKNKQNIKPHAVPEPSYNDLLYQSSLERLQTKMMSERAKNIVYSVMPNYY